MRKYILFAAATLIMVGTVVSFRGRLIDRQETRSRKQTEEKATFKDRLEKTANDVLEKVLEAGEIVEQKIAIGDVDQLVIEGTASVRIRQGTENSLTIRSPSFSKDTMHHRLKGQELTLNGISIPIFDGALQSGYEVTLVNLEKITLHGTGNLDGLTPFTQEQLEINNSGSGIISISIDSEDLALSINGSGNIYIDGHAEDVSARVLGSGSIRARSLNGQEANVHIAGSGDADLGLFEEVDANIVGSGHISCVEGARMDVNSIGSGTIRQVPLLDSEPASDPAPEEPPVEIPAP